MPKELYSTSTNADRQRRPARGAWFETPPFGRVRLRRGALADREGGRYSSAGVLPPDMLTDERGDRAYERLFNACLTCVGPRLTERRRVRRGSGRRGDDRARLPQAELGALQ